LLDIGIIVATTPAFGSFLSSLRLARLARLLRVLRLGMLVGRALQIERRLSSVAVFRFVALATAFVVVVAGAAESLVDKSDFHSTWDGVWFAVATVTTVGYGDLQARSVEGRIVAILVMLFGIGFLSVLTATIASRFVKTDTGSEEIVATLSRPS
jgi:voltage-gated potassium channel